MSNNRSSCWWILLSSVLCTSWQTELVTASSLLDIAESISRRGYSTLARSVPALSVYHVPPGFKSWNGDNSSRKFDNQVIEVSTATTTKRKKRRMNLPSVDRSQLESGGFYYGITTKTLSQAGSGNESKRKPSL